MTTKALLSIVGITFATIASTPAYAIGINSENPNTINCENPNTINCENPNTIITATTTATTQWQAGRIVSKTDIKANRLEHYFCKKNIDNQLFARIYGKSYKANCTLARTELRYLQLLHYTIDGKIMTGEMICHKDIANDLIEIFRKLFEAHYPIERIQLIDDFGADDATSMNHNNTSCFNYRAVAGSKKLSKHSMGKAVDINPLYNPYVKKRANGKTIVNPEKGRQYANRNKQFKYKIDRNDLAYRLFTQHGFTWGGGWRSLKDYQHFEK